jgi:condensin complex subunit 3
VKSSKLHFFYFLKQGNLNIDWYSEDLYQDLRTSLFERIRDVDATVRIQAATALCRLQSADTDVDEADGQTILEKLISSLRFDNSA